MVPRPVHKKSKGQAVSIVKPAAWSAAGLGVGAIITYLAMRAKGKIDPVRELEKIRQAARETSDLTLRHTRTLENLLRTRQAGAGMTEEEAAHLREDISLRDQLAVSVSNLQRAVAEASRQLQPQNRDNPRSERVRAQLAALAAAERDLGDRMTEHRDLVDREVAITRDLIGRMNPLPAGGPVEAEIVNLTAQRANLQATIGQLTEALREAEAAAARYGANAAREAQAAQTAQLQRGQAVADLQVAQVQLTELGQQAAVNRRQAAVAAANLQEARNRLVDARAQGGAELAAARANAEQARQNLAGLRAEGAENRRLSASRRAELNQAQADRQAEQTAARQALAAAAAEAEALRAQLETGREQAATEQARLERAQAELADSAGEAEVLADQLQTVRNKSSQEQQRLLARLAEAEGALADLQRHAGVEQQELAAVRQQLMTAAFEAETMRVQLAGLEEQAGADHTELAAARSRLQEAETASEQLQADFSRAEAASAEGYRRAVAEAEAAQAALLLLQTSSGANREELEATRGRLAQAQNRVGMVEAEMRQALAMYQGSEEAARAQLAAQDDRVQEALTAAGQLQQQAAAREAQLDAARRELGEAREQGATAEQMARAAEGEVARLRGLVEEGDAGQAVLQARLGLEAQGRAEAEASARQQLDEAQRSAQEFREQGERASQQAEAMAKEVQELQALREADAGQLAEAREQVTSAQAASQEAARGLERQRVQTTEEIARLSDGHAQELERLNARIEELYQSGQASETTVQALQAEAQQHAAAQADLEAARAELSEQNDRLAQLQTALTKGEQAAARQQQVVDDLKGHLAQTEAEARTGAELALGKAEALQAALAAAEARVEMTHADLESLTAAKQAVEDERAALTGTLEVERLAHSQAAEAQSIQANERAAAMQATLDELQARLTSNQEAARQLTALHEDEALGLREAQARSAAEVVQLSDQLRAADEEHRRLKEELAAAAQAGAADRVQELSAELLQRDQELQRGREELAAKDAGWQQLMAEKKALERQVVEEQAASRQHMEAEMAKYGQLRAQYNKAVLDLGNEVGKTQTARAEIARQTEAAGGKAEDEAADMERYRAVQELLRQLVSLDEGYAGNMERLQAGNSDVVDRMRDYQEALIRLKHTAFVCVVLNSYDGITGVERPFHPDVRTTFDKVQVGERVYGPFYSVQSWGGTNQLYAIFSGTRPGEASLADRVREAGDGGNSVIMTYGQSGSGKTTALQGLKGQAGLLQLGLQLLQQRGCRVSHLETFCLYGSVELARLCRRRGSATAPADERVADRQMAVLRRLMHVEKRDASGVLSATGQAVTASSIDQIFRTRPHVEATPNNPVSSRSHLFMLWRVDTSDGRTGHLTWVDLAGSESPSAIAGLNTVQVLADKHRAERALTGDMQRRRLEDQRVARDGQTETVVMKKALFSVMFSERGEPIQQRIHEGFYINETLHQLADFMTNQRGKPQATERQADLGKTWTETDFLAYSTQDRLYSAQRTADIFSGKEGVRDPAGFLTELFRLGGLAGIPAVFTVLTLANEATPAGLTGVVETLKFAQQLT